MIYPRPVDNTNIYFTKAQTGLINKFLRHNLHYKRKQWNTLALEAALTISYVPTDRPTNKNLRDSKFRQLTWKQKASNNKWHFVCSKCSSYIALKRSNAGLTMTSQAETCSCLILHKNCCVLWPFAYLYLCKYVHAVWCDLIQVELMQTGRNRRVCADRHQYETLSWGFALHCFGHLVMCHWKVGEH